MLAGGTHPALAEGVRVIHAVAEDPQLRAEVFELAVTALGSCGDNLAHGFSNIVLAVLNHQMMEDVKAGRIDQPGLESMIRALIRHDMLEAEVSRFIKARLEDSKVSRQMRQRLISEPLETMLHAKVALKAALELPESVPSEMTHERESALTLADIESIRANVRAKANNPVTLARWMLANGLWRTGMRYLHANEFDRIDSDFQKGREALLDRYSQPQDSADFAAQHAFASRALEIDAAQRAAEDGLLLRVSGRDVLATAVLREGSLEDY